MNNRPMQALRRVAGIVPLPGRVPLALRSLTADRARLLRSVSGIAFAVLLMLFQFGAQKAFIDSSLEVVRALDADLVLMNPQKNRFGTKAPFPREQLVQAAAVDGVQSAHPLYAEWSRSMWKNPDTGLWFKVQVLAFDPDKPVLRIPEVEAARHALRTPDTVLVDSRGRRFLGFPGAGGGSELSLRRVRVIGTFPLGPDFLIDGTVIMSDRTFLNTFLPSGGVTAAGSRPSKVEFGLIKLAADADLETVRARLRAALPNTVNILTKGELEAIEQAYQSRMAPVGPVFNIGVVIGFLVGMLIAYQILYADLSDQLGQYATLKAMGYSNGFLVRTVVEQSLAYGVVGYVPAWILANALFWVVAWVTLLPLGISLHLTLLTLALTLLMCGVSGLIAVRRILRTDPAEVF